MSHGPTGIGAPAGRSLHTGALLSQLFLASLALGFLFLGFRTGSPEGSLDPMEVALARARWEVRTLRMESSLASQGGYYLVLDTEARTLTLKTLGVTLRAYPVSELTVRTAPWLPGARRGPAVMDTTWEGGILLPGINRHRTVILADTVTPPDPSGAVAFIPPTPEEEVPLPPSFRLRFPGGFSLRVSGEEEAPEAGTTESPEGEGNESDTPRLLNWVRLQPWRLDRYTVEATLPAPEAGALYRSLPEGTALMVILPPPGNGEADGSGEASS